MLATQLQRFTPFATLDEATRCRIAENTRQLTLPANRWLIRPGRNLRGSYYLLRGRVRTHGPDAEFAEDDSRSRQAIVPGAVAIKTLAVCNLLVVEPAMVGSATSDLNFSDAVVEPNLLLPQWLEPGWEHRFLQHHVVQSLRPGQWQQIFRDMQRLCYTTGEAVVEQGQAAADFYVLSSGVAGVFRGNAELARLRAGDFFGEDALVLDTVRNATVTMMSAGAVMAISRDVFLNAMLAEVLRAARPKRSHSREQQSRLVPVHVGMQVASPYAGENRILLTDLRARARGLDKASQYRIVGDTPAQAALGAFLLLQAGHRVVLDNARPETLRAAGPGCAN